MSTLKFQEFRLALIRECIASPSLVQDWAGIEGYLAETYSYRTLFELIQNADDAGSQRASVIHDEANLGFYNDGRPFNFGDVESLCRSAYSKKVRGESIGYRGIGFKSTVGIPEFTDEVQH